MSAVTFPMLALNRSGGVRIVAALANGLADRGADVRIVAPSYACESPIPLRDSIALEVIRPRRGSRVDYMRRLVGAVRASEGVVVSTGYLTPFVIFLAVPQDARMFSVIQGVETVSHVQYGHRPFWAKPALTALARLGYRMPGRKITVSTFVADAIGRRFIDAVVNPGIRREFIDAIPPDRSPRPRGDRLILGVFPVEGTTKGAPDAAAAIASLQDGGARVSAMVYDVDYPASRFPAYVQRYTDVVPDRNAHTVRAFLGRCDAFLLPSLMEGFPLPPLEAMACGAAVVITDCGGMRDYAVDGENAIVVPPRNARAMADAVLRIEADEALRRRLVAGGYETAARFPEERFVARCADLVLRELR